uniref:Signal peptide peptidase n=1 Tax=Chlamydomonas euryale TaxID=1486919 RepID=A0A7R9YSD9_9CHLO|mmetsp:Transcript_18319/g.54673  ORF Transcript_18319/g.54673 Transcript_18319/m.54673 type:complete len:382 (+) Transcript_18319:86-1231(+)
MTAADHDEQAKARMYFSQYSSDKPAAKAHLLLAAVATAPLLVYIPVNFNIIVTAALTVYCGCWRSVKPAPSTEAMTNKEAMRFPIVGSCVLLSLFLLFKFLPAWIVNTLLAGYIGAIGVLVLTSAATPYFQDYFPEALVEMQFNAPPFKIPYLIDATEERLTATVPEICLGVLSACFCAWYFSTKFFFANNVLGMAFSLEGIEHLSLGSVHTGTILLVGLFFYDIFWVFCTPVMVSVAQKFDAPIKLLFPRLLDAASAEAGKRPMAMLGLGDIVIPGIFVALMLRYDVRSGFRTKYFQSCFGGYVLGLCTTIFVMTYFNAAQPALLYIVPGILGCTGLHAYISGEFMKVFNFKESEEDDGEGTDANGDAQDEQKDETKKSK